VQWLRSGARITLSVKSRRSFEVPARPLVAVVDDDASLRDATQNLLEAAGFATVAFGSAQRFLDSARRRDVSCLVTDMRMPGMTGLELFQALVASDAAIPTVLITAYPDEDVRSTVRKAGIRCYLSKPFSPEQLCECVRSAIASSPTPKS
jgi:FixJ family two-component response regulator